MKRPCAGAQRLFAFASLRHPYMQVKQLVNWPPLRPTTFLEPQCECGPRRVSISLVGETG